METITCDNCGRTIATGESRADAVENAFVSDMEHTYNDESGEWECAHCIRERMLEARADYDLNRHQINLDRQVAEQDAMREDFLRRADLRRDQERDK